MNIPRPLPSPVVPQAAAVSRYYEGLLEHCLSAEVRIKNGYVYMTQEGAFCYRQGLSSHLRSCCYWLFTRFAPEEKFPSMSDFTPTCCAIAERKWLSMQNGQNHGLSDMVQPVDANHYRCGLCRSLFQQTVNWGCLVTGGRHRFTQIHEGLNGPLKNFSATQPNPWRPGKILILDCEMIYTTRGSEVVKFTLQNLFGKVSTFTSMCLRHISNLCIFIFLQIIMDLYIKPRGEVVDYVTNITGITEEKLANAMPFDQLKTILLDIICSDDILVGHSLECDLHALEIIHRNVVDTAIVFGDPTTPLTKPSLKSLVAKYLNREHRSPNRPHNSIKDCCATRDLVWRLLR